MGYIVYKIEQGDNIYKIIENYNISIERIISANPKINIYNIMPGMEIVIPVRSIVNTKVEYTSNILEEDIRNLKLIYPFLETGEIGRSVLNKSIPYIKIGNGNKKVFYSAAFHANEWITSPVLMKFLEEYAQAFVENKNIFGYNAQALYYATSLYIVPMVNPDGVDLVTGSIKNVENAYKNVVQIADNFPEIPFPGGWKANINGVDLNLQFPAGWKQAKKIKFSQGYTTPAPKNYVGTAPISEPESRAIYDFTLKNNFKLVIAYHTQGKEIYWNFQNLAPESAKIIGENFAKVSGYLLTEVPYNSSFAGYKDWFIQEYIRPGYTVEAGLGENPLPISQFNEIYNDNIGILVLGLVNA